MSIDEARRNVSANNTRSPAALVLASAFVALSSATSCTSTRPVTWDDATQSEARLQTSSAEKRDQTICAPPIPDPIELNASEANEVRRVLREAGYSTRDIIGIESKPGEAGEAGSIDLTTPQRTIIARLRHPLSQHVELRVTLDWIGSPQIVKKSVFVDDTNVSCDVVLEECERAVAAARAVTSGTERSDKPASSRAQRFWRAMPRSHADLDTLKEQDLPKRSYDTVVVVDWMPDGPSEFHFLTFVFLDGADVVGQVQSGYIE